jgi:hypothetical protein
MMMNDVSEKIPEQSEGNQSDVIEFADFESRQEAHALFLLAKERLKEISNWHTICGHGSTKFSLADTQGNPLYRMAQKGDHFYIDLPAPGTLAGDGLDWVRIESMEEFGDSNTKSEYIVMTARPVANPKHPTGETAHFYGHNSTNTFIVERYLNHVSAAVHGRNETTNTENTGIYDTVRNTIIALTARAGLSGPQWKTLVKGLMS